MTDTMKLVRFAWIYVLGILLVFAIGLRTALSASSAPSSPPAQVAVDLTADAEGTEATALAWRLDCDATHAGSDSDGKLEQGHGPDDARPGIFDIVQHG